MVNTTGRFTVARPHKKEENLAKAGSSGDLPLAADEPGSADDNHDDDPRVGTGETHQTATNEDLDLLGPHEGMYTFKDVFGVHLQQRPAVWTSIPVRFSS